MNARPSSRNPLLFAAPLLIASAVLAQPPRQPTLDQVLQRLEANLNDYDTKVPSFFCDEHVVSSVFPGNLRQNTVTDSVFRLKRVPQPNHTTALEESRTVQSVNGQPPTSDELNGPSVLSGVFEGGLAVVSLNQQSCMRYKLDRIRPGKPYVVRFSTEPHPPHPADCLLQEASKGQVFLDPATLQITHLDLTTPRHVIFNGTEPGSGYEPLAGQRILSIDYAPIQLDNRTFWMPSALSSHITAGANTFRPTFWSFRATYRNYHKLEVSSRLLPATNP
jgi:hypothetical protein